MPASSDMASAPYWPPHLTGTDPTCSLEAQYGSSGTRSFESPVVSAQMHVDDVPISNVQRVDDVSVHDVYLTDYFHVADKPASFARDTPASRMTAGTRTLDTQYTRISDVRTAGTDSNVCVTSTAVAALTRVSATLAASATPLEHQRGPDPALASRTDPLTAARSRIVTYRREHDYRFEPIHYAADRSPLYDHFADIHPRPQRTPPPSVVSGLSADSDADSDYIPPAQRTR